MDLGNAWYNTFQLQCQQFKNKISKYKNHVIAMISGSLSPLHGASSGCGWRNGVQYGGYLRIYWISCRGQRTKGGPPAWDLGEVLTTPRCKKLPWCGTFTIAYSLVWYFGAAKQWKRDKKFGTWKVRSLYRSGSHTAAAAAAAAAGN